MATYSKKLKTIEIHLLLDGEVISVADTAETNAASMALAEFRRGEPMHVDSNRLIPYHAVQYIKVTEADGTVTKADPYFCEEESSDEETTDD